MLKRTVFVIMIAVVVLPIGLIVPLADAQGDTGWPTQGWTTSTPEAQGLDSDAIANYLLALAGPGLNVDSVVIVRNGTIVAEAYYAPVTADTKFVLWSATKSFTSALVGIAVEQGKIERIDDPVLSFFPDRTAANLDANKEAMTLRDLLTMGSGFACDVNAGLDPEPAVWASEDWTQALLDIPMNSAPGSQWQYCNLNFALISAILTATTGQSALELATSALFEPLGITDVAWAESEAGISGGAAGLALTARDLAKFGYLYLHGGQWDGVQVVPAQWVTDSQATQLPTPFGVGYGYGWWVFEGLGAMALGSAGQYIWVFPNMDMILVVTGSATEATRTMHQLGAVLGGVLGLGPSPDPLPENPEAAARLVATIDALANPAPTEVSPLPAIASQISAKAYGLFSNAVFKFDTDSPLLTVVPWLTPLPGIGALSLTFEESQAALSLTWADGESETIPVGLDGVYRLSQGRLGPVGAKGAWLTDNLFRLNLKLIGSGIEYRLDMTFTGTVLELIAFDIKAGQVDVVFGATE